jgi:hypothetical protein
MKRTERDGIEIYEIEVKEKNPTIIKSNLFQNKLKYELIIIKKENVSYSYLIEAYSSLKYALFNNSIQKLKNFTGTLNVFKLDGTSIDQLVVNSGKSKNPSGNSYLSTLNEVINLYYSNSNININSRVPECYLTEHIYVTYSIYTDHYYYITAGEGSTYKKYSHTTIITYTVDEPMSVPCGESESSYETYKYATIRQEIVEKVSVSIENNIDYTQLDPCLKEIMEQLKNATNADIANVMEKLGATNVYNVAMQMGTVGIGKYAATTKISKNNYLVTVTQNDFTTASKLYKATALLHETIHAYMLSVVDDYNTYPTNAPFTNFPELFKIYVNKINNVQDAEIAQHEDMANKYVNAIASALEEYQWNDTGIPSTLADKQVFLDLAWSGLQGTDVYNKKSQEGIIDNIRITARIGAETNGVYSQGQYAVGKQCN